MLDFPRIARRLVAAAVLSLTLAATVTVLTPLAAHADDTDGIGGAPATDGQLDSRSRFSYELSPGQNIQDQYMVENTGSTAQQVTVFATDAYNTKEGDFALLATSRTPSDAGGWLVFSNGQKKMTIDLAAGASQLLNFTVTVPADARPGDHAAGIVISAPTVQGQVLIDRRVATRMYVRVAGALQPALTVSSISSRYNYTLNPLAGSTTITITLRNSGNVALGANLVTGVNTYFGIPAASLQHEVAGELLPGSSRILSYTVPGVAQVGYLNPYVAIAPTASTDAKLTAVVRSVDRDTFTFAVPWWLLLIIVIAGIAMLIVRIRRRVDARRAAEWVEYTEAEARRKAAEDDAAAGDDESRDQSQRRAPVGSA